MGQKYSSNSASGYNATPPSDDGTVSEANKGKWSTIKDKLADPVKTLADAINTDLVEHFDNGPVAYTTNQTIGASHYGKIIQVSGAANTQTLSDAATLGAGWNCEFVSTDTTNTVTLARATASDMINETTANISLLPLQSIKAVVNAAANGFLVDFRIRKNKATTVTESLTFTGPISLTNTLALDNTVSSTKAAETGYTRVTPNMCRVNAKPVETALVRDTVTEVTGPTGCKGLIILLTLMAAANNAVASRNSEIIVYSEVGATNAIAHATAVAHEQAATIAGTILLQTRTEVHVKTDSNGKVWLRHTDDAGNQGIGYYVIVGYYD